MHQLRMRYRVVCLENGTQGTVQPFCIVHHQHTCPGHNGSFSGYEFAPCPTYKTTNGGQWTFSAAARSASAL